MTQTTSDDRPAGHSAPQPPPAPPSIHDDPHPWAGYVAVGSGLLGQMEPLGILGLIGVVAGIIAINAGQKSWGWIGLGLSGLALVVNAPFWFILAAVFGMIALAG